MLSLFRVKFQCFRIILAEISQSIIAIKQLWNNFFVTVLQTKCMIALGMNINFFLALYVSSNLIFRSLVFIRGI